MTDTLIGGCVCGAVRYRLKPGFRMKPYACHCTDCQKRTGSAFSIHMLVMLSDLAIEGETDKGSYVQPSGAKTEQIGCTKCKGRIYAQNAARPDFAGLRVGTLDENRDLSPAAHLWVRSKQPWVILPDDVPALETAPESNEEWMRLLGPET